jgi:hypothetical protein
MNVLAATWHCSEQGHADIPTVQRPKERDWTHVGLRFALLLMSLGQFLPFTAVRTNAQNLGTAPALNRAVPFLSAAPLSSIRISLVGGALPADAFHKERLICTEKQVISAIPT